MHNQPEIDTTTPEKKPHIILHYNKTKSGVDTMDQMTRCYSTKRMTRRWPMVVFYNMIDVSALNAYIVWLSLRKQDNQRMKRRNFLISLGKQLAGIGEDLPKRSYPGDAMEHTEEEPPRKKARCAI